jgi:hypothetical protein
MTIVSITRSEIVKAIKKEPLKTLKAGHWVLGKENSRVKNKTCSVCAVGAVMRNALLAPNQVARAIDDAAWAATQDCEVADADPMDLIAEKSWMAALSCFFENLSSEIEEDSDEGYAHVLTEKETKRLRDETVTFVKKNFPKKIEIDIDGAKPAKDVKVVTK